MVWVIKLTKGPYAGSYAPAGFGGWAKTQLDAERFHERQKAYAWFGKQNDTFLSFDPRIVRLRPKVQKPALPCPACGCQHGRCPEYWLKTEKEAAIRKAERERIAGLFKQTGTLVQFNGCVVAEATGYTAMALGAARIAEMVNAATWPPPEPKTGESKT